MTRAVPLATATAVLAFSAAAVVALGGREDPERAARAEEFQRLVGGLGLGPSVDPSVCEPDFDPRVGRVCSFAVQPIPGGWRFCRHRAGAALVR